MKKGYFKRQKVKIYAWGTATVVMGILFLHDLEKATTDNYEMAVISGISAIGSGLICYMRQKKYKKEIRNLEGKVE